MPMHLRRWLGRGLCGMLVVWTGAAAAQQPEAARRIDWNGALRTRWQGDFQDGRKARNVFQLSFYLNMTAKASDQLDFGARVMTGDPKAIGTAGWVDISDFADREGFFLSWLYGQYRPTPAVTLLVGKFQMPFVRPTEMVFDNDVAMEGLAQQMTFNTRDKSASLNLNLAQLLINQPVSAIRDVSRTFLLGGQAVVGVTRPGGSGSFGVAVYAYGNVDSVYAAQSLKTPPLLRTSVTNRANAAKTGFRSAFRMINVNGQITRNLGNQPVNIAVDYVINPAASDQRQGIAGRVACGSTRNVGGSRFGIHAFHIESDATLAAFSNFDYTETNANGVGLFYGYQPVKNLLLDVIVYMRKYDAPGNLITPVANNSLRTRGRFELTVQF